MNDTWHKAKIWTKLVALGLLVLFVLLFVWENYSRSVEVWFFKVHTMSVLELLVATFLIGVIATLLARPTYRTLRQIGELRAKPQSPPAIPLAPPSPPVVSQPIETPEPTAKPTP